MQPLEFGVFVVVRTQAVQRGQRRSVDRICERSPTLCNGFSHGEDRISRYLVGYSWWESTAAWWSSVVCGGMFGDGGRSRRRRRSAPADHVADSTACPRSGSRPASKLTSKAPALLALAECAGAVNLFTHCRECSQNRRTDKHVYAHHFRGSPNRCRPLE